MMFVADELNEYLKDRHIDYEVLSHPERFTAQTTAEAQHVSGKQFIKVVMLRAGEREVMAAVPADRKVNLEHAKAALHTDRVRLEEEKEFLPVFLGCERGAMPPFGGLYGMPVLMDESLAGNEEVVFNAGSHQTAIRMKFSDYAKLADPTLCRLTDESGK